ncbi:MAG TPA: hypothetical protein VH575_34605 [Gemmataceae bacterium]|jgi:hypothetical protein
MKRAAHLALAALLLAGVGLVHSAEETPPAGTWKIKLPFSQGGDKPLWLVKLEAKDGKWIGKVLAHAGEEATTLENLRVTKESLRFSLKSSAQILSFEFRLPTEKKTKLYGALQRGGSAIPAELEETTVTSLDQIELLKETLATTKDNATTMRTALTLVSAAGASKAKPEEVRSWASRAVKAAEAYGPQWQREVILIAVEMLTKQKGYESIALTYARQAERLLDDKDRPDVRKKVLTALASALSGTGKSEEAKEVETRIKKIDFTIKPTPFAGRQGKSDRVVLVELFTGAECPPCVAADLAFDALGKTFKPNDVVRLQYHVHVPGPDPLTIPDSEKRFAFYRLRGTPSLLLNGKPTDPGGGDSEAGWEKYEEYKEGLLPLLETPASAKLKASATRKGDKINIDVTASDVQADDGDDLRLRVVLVEEQIAYTGGNKLAEHHQVVRAFAGSVEGEKVAKGKAVNKTLAVDLDAVRKELRAYLDKTDKDRPFPKKDRPLELKNLRVVAFVQNDATREVLQAVQVEVPAE